MYLALHNNRQMNLLKEFYSYIGETIPYLDFDGRLESVIFYNTAKTRFDSSCNKRVFYLDFINYFEKERKDLSKRQVRFLARLDDFVEQKDLLFRVDKVSRIVYYDY